jgi:tRNA modification GTPase
MFFQDDTIAAISTTIGEGGIGIVRISGDEAIHIANKILLLKGKGNIQEVKSHSVKLAKVVDFNDGLEVDEVLVNIMRAPNTYTREDIVEINCHGSNVSLKKTLQLALEAGARIAEPGEFTKRAFLNGRIDLAQAEAVIDIIKAKTESGLKTAASQLEGGLSKEIENIERIITEALVQIEAAVDFSDEDIEVLPKEELLDSIKESIAKIEDLLRTAIKGRIVKDGLNTVIIGRPNVGKSSILNAILRTEKAIVTEIPGTTRDIIEETISVKGIPLIIKDTAGLRSSDDKVEVIGIELAKKAMEDADLVLCVIDGSAELTEEDEQIVGNIKDKNSIIVINKSDLEKSESVRKYKIPAEVGGYVEVSAISGAGISVLEKEIEKLFIDGETTIGETLVTNVRHEQILEKAKELLKEALSQILLDQPEEIVAISLNDSLNILGEITGKSITDDILGHIFNRFCIGK